VQINTRGKFDQDGRRVRADGPDAPQARIISAGSTSKAIMFAKMAAA